jgi:predicted amidophosphoribosyltransferase
MTVRNCNECHKPYSPDPESPYQAEYCEPCFLEYNLAFVKIHEYIQENPKPRGYKLIHMNQIIQEAKVPKKYVQKYFQDSELTKCILDNGGTMCERCSAALNPSEKKFCKSCNKQLAQIFSPYASKDTPLNGNSGSGFRRRGEREGGSRFGSHS